jgi:hypothetical protein
MSKVGFLPSFVEFPVWLKVLKGEAFPDSVVVAEDVECSGSGGKTTEFCCVEIMEYVDNYFICEPR